MSLKTYSLDEVADGLGCTARWLIEQVRAGKFPGRKIARGWRFTESDVDDIFTLCRNGFHGPDTTSMRSVPVMSMASGLTATSRRRVVGE